MKKVFSFILACLMLSGVLLFTPLTAHASDTQSIYDIASGIIAWKKSDVGAADNGYLINDDFLKYAGTTPGDWYPIGLGRLGISDNQTGYLAVINDNVEKRYKSATKLDKAKATEWHRIALAVLASGGDPRHMGAGGEIDLIADGTYNRIDTDGNGILGRQGINGYIWGLIALDSKRYDIPTDAAYSRDDIILTLLQMQHEDGWWSMLPVQLNSSDVDTTAMAIQALAPYYNSESEYDVNGNKIKVRDALNKTIEWLSSVQCSDGDFLSWGTQNAESTAQVIVALCSLGIDPIKDARFIKNGNTLLDGILKYRLNNGGFVHSFTYDPDNPTSLPNKANSMASEQVLYALVSLWRYQNGMRSLYDMRDEFSITERLTIDACISTINLLSDSSGKEEIETAITAYCTIPALDRCYVNNYSKLALLATENGIELPESTPIYNGGSGEAVQPLLCFSESNKASADALPLDNELTTEYRATVTTLRYILSNCEDFEGKQIYVIKLDKVYNRILEIQAEIDVLKADIKEKLYPFESIGLSDRNTVYELYDRYMTLSEYDRGQFEPSDVEGLLKCKTQVDNLYLAVWISTVGLAVAVVVTAIVIYRIKKRRKERAANAMPESEE